MGAFAGSRASPASASQRKVKLGFGGGEGNAGQQAVTHPDISTNYAASVAAVKGHAITRVIGTGTTLTMNPLAPQGQAMATATPASGMDWQTQTKRQVMQLRHQIGTGGTWAVPRILCLLTAGVASRIAL